MLRLKTPNLNRLTRPAAWVGLIVLLGLIVWFGYSNWYRVVIDPPPLDPALTQKRQTQILTKEYQQSLVWNEQWKARPIPQSVPNIFDSARSTP
jgi:hypothetical protein